MFVTIFVVTVAHKGLTISVPVEKYTFSEFIGTFLYFLLSYFNIQKIFAPNQLGDAFLSSLNN